MDRILKGHFHQYETINSNYLGPKVRRAYGLKRNDVVHRCCQCGFIGYHQRLDKSLDEYFIRKRK